MDKKNKDKLCVLTSFFEDFVECFPLFTEEEIAILQDAFSRLFLISLKESLESLEKDGFIKL